MSARLLEARVPDAVMPAGLYVRIGAAEYRVIRAGGWALWSPKPATGFAKVAGVRGYVRSIAPGERLDCYRVAQRGTYRDVPVTAYPSSEAQVMVTSRDPRAVGLGFDPAERQEWVKVVQPSDQHLRFTTTRTPERAPWADPAPGG